MRKGWVRVGLGSCRFGFPNSPEGFVTGGSREGQWRCSFPNGLLLVVEYAQSERPLEGGMSVAKAQLILRWSRESSITGTVRGTVITLGRLQGGALERFVSENEALRVEYYRCLDSLGNRYVIRASYPKELTRDQELRDIVATFWRTISWVDERAK